MTQPLPLAAWLTYIETVHHRAIDLSLDRVRRVAHTMRLKTPPLVISVAGTNGKGSCTAMLESVLRLSGIRVGAYTSPHLVSYNERVRIDGKSVSDQELIQGFEVIDAVRNEIPLTYFEFGTLAALWIMQQRGIDAAILEVGMGGRLDAVNIVDANIAIITSVGLDHVQWLGNNRESIGHEKAGIFRHGQIAICGDPDPPASLIKYATHIGADLWSYGSDFTAELAGTQWKWCANKAMLSGQRELPQLETPSISGENQMYNAATVVTALMALPELENSKVRVTHDAMRQGLSQVFLPGRLHEYRARCRVLFDVAHNPDAVSSLSQYIRQNPVTGDTIAIFSMLRDKQHADVIALLADQIHQWNVVTLEGDRGMTANELELQVLDTIPDATVSKYGDIVHAFESIQSQIHEDDLIVVFGSFLTVGAIIEHLKIPLYQ